MKRRNRFTVALARERDVIFPLLQIISCVFEPRHCCLFICAVFFSFLCALNGSCVQNKSTNKNTLEATPTSVVRFVCLSFSLHTLFVHSPSLACHYITPTLLRLTRQERGVDWLDKEWMASVVMAGLDETSSIQWVPNHPLQPSALHTVYFSVPNKVSFKLGVHKETKGLCVRVSCSYRREWGLLLSFGYFLAGQSGWAGCRSVTTTGLS